MNAPQWKECKLGDVIELKRGYDLPKSKRLEGNVPIISSSGESGSHNEAKVKGPGVVTGRYGTLGEVFYIEKDFWPLNTALYVKDFKGNYPRFISYFMTQLNFAGQIVADAPFTLITGVIRKEALTQKYSNPGNPCHMAMNFGLERVYRYLEAQGEHEKAAHIVFEKRGRREDDELELEFRRVCDGANYFNKTLPFEIVFADKKANSSGLQFADLLARPIGRAVLNPSQENRAYNIIKTKFYSSNTGKKDGLVTAWLLSSGYERLNFIQRLSGAEQWDTSDCV